MAICACSATHTGWPTSNTPLVTGQIGSSRLCPRIIAAPRTRHARCPSNCAPASTTMLAPMTQMTPSGTTIAPPSLRDAPRGEAPGQWRRPTLDQDQPHAAREQERTQRRRRPSRRIRPALVPARNTNTGAQKWVIQRVKNSAAPMFGIGHRIDLAADHEEVAHVIERHDHDHEAAQHVDAGEPVAALFIVMRPGAPAR